MVITVHLYTILQRPSPDGLQRQLELSLATSSTIADVITALAITLPVDAMLLVVNGRVADTQTRLNEGDHLHLMPAMSGGNV
jgi:sulfur carrier protein ThiS